MRILIEFVKKNRSLFFNLIITFVFAVIITISMCNSKSLNYDTIWGFHSAQKVASGFTMYTDINTVLTPIFFWIGALFIKLFGNTVTSLYICSGIIGGMLITIVYNIFKKVCKEKTGILFLAFMCFALKNIYVIGAPSYNILALMWWFLAIFFELENVQNTESKKRKNIFIGILVGLTIFTKQSIGVFAFVATLLITFLKKRYDNSEEMIKEFLSKICGILFVVLGMLIYFIFTNSFFDFINFCIGGLFDFGNENTILSFPLLYIVILVLSILGILFFRKKQDKNLIILTVSQICMMSLIFPVANTYHIALSMFISLPLFGALIKYFEFNNKEIYKIVFMLFVFCILCIQKASAIREYSIVENLFVTAKLYASELVLVSVLFCFGGIVLSILFEKESLSKCIAIAGVIFLLSTQFIVNNELRKDEISSDKLAIYDGLHLEEKAINYLEDVLIYIEEKEKNGKEVLVISADASYYMAPLERNNYIYDFPLHGCLGMDGEEILLKNLPENEDLLILKNKYMMYQESEKLDKFIKEKFKKVDEIYDLEVYQKNN